MNGLEILKVVGLYLGILSGLFAALFLVLSVFMRLVSLFTDSISYNIYETPKQRRPR